MSEERIARIERQLAKLVSMLQAEPALRCQYLGQFEGPTPPPPSTADATTPSDSQPTKRVSAAEPNT